MAWAANLARCCRALAFATVLLHPSRSGEILETEGRTVSKSPLELLPIDLLEKTIASIAAHSGQSRVVRNAAVAVSRIKQPKPLHTYLETQNRQQSPASFGKEGKKLAVIFFTKVF